MSMNPKPISFPVDTGPHPSSNIEWWYYYAFLQGESGHRFAAMASFFQVGETSGLKGHYLIHSIIRLNDKSFKPHSLLDHNLYYQMIGFYLPFYLLLKPTDFQVWKQYKTLLRGKLPQPHQWINYANVYTHPTKINYGKANLTFTNELTQEFQVHMINNDTCLDLTFTPQKPPSIIDETRQINDLFYYSSTRNKISGKLKNNGKIEQVTGEGWFDHQWGRSYSLLKRSGWTWFGIQLDDGRELLINQNHKDASKSYNPVAVLIDQNHSSRLSPHVELTPLRYWRSIKTGIQYPIEWRISLPDFSIELEVTPLINHQEMPVIGPLQAIWEGACRVTGVYGLGENRIKIQGKGFMELVGYAY